MSRGTALAVSKATLPANWEKQLATDAAKTRDAEAATGGGSFLSIRAGVLAFQGTPLKDSQIEAVVLDYRFANTYYPDGFDAENPVSPACYAIGAVEADLAPKDDVADKQSAACHGCPQNEFGTSERGKGKACKNIRRLALFHSDYLKPGADWEKAPIVFLNVPPTSLGGWAQYAKRLAGVLEKPPYAVVTRITAAPDPKTQVRVSFELVAELKDRANMAKIWAKRQEAQDGLDAGYAPMTDERPKKKVRGKPERQARTLAAAEPKKKAKKVVPAPKEKKGRAAVPAASGGFKF